MFENELKQKFKEIFKVKKVSFSQPEPSAQNNVTEQDCLFIEVATAPLNVKDGRVSGRVAGSCLMVGSNEKLTFGFFRSAIANADPNLTKDFYFYEFETNSKIYQNLVQRGFSFVYFFSGQYDPEIGSITSVVINITEV